VQYLDLYKGLFEKISFVVGEILKYMSVKTKYNYGQRTALPLALRALSTALPATVLILDLKPCLRLRFKLLGWNVLFIMISILQIIYFFVNI